MQKLVPQARTKSGRSLNFGRGAGGRGVVVVEAAVVEGAAVVVEMAVVVEETASAETAIGSGRCGLAVTAAKAANATSRIPIIQTRLAPTPGELTRTRRTLISRPLFG